MPTADGQHRAVGQQDVAAEGAAPGEGINAFVKAVQVQGRARHVRQDERRVRTEGIGATGLDRAGVNVGGSAIGARRAKGQIGAAGIGRHSVDRDGRAVWNRCHVGARGEPIAGDQFAHIEIARAGQAGDRGGVAVGGQRPNLAGWAGEHQRP